MRQPTYLPTIRDTFLTLSLLLAVVPAMLGSSLAQEPAPAPAVAPPAAPAVQDPAPANPAPVTPAPAAPVPAPSPTPAPSTPTQDPAPAAVKWEKLEVFPSEVRLFASNDVQHVLAIATRSDGITQDVTEQVAWQMENPTFASFQNFVVGPLADGETKLNGTWSGLAATVPVKVVQATTPRAISFHLDVMPILTKAGCNTGSCHGAARGKDGFRLSLFGFDPKGDHQRITREIGIRRINLARPDQSLLLLKAVGAVPHTGGKKIEPGSKHYQQLLTWLQNGAPIDPSTPPTVTRVDLFPRQAVLEGEGGLQRLVCVAHYSDGTCRDVVDLAAFTTNNDRTAAVDPIGVIKSGVRGEAFVMARFDTHTVGTQILGLPANLAYQPTPITGNYIDQLVGKKLEKLRLTPSQLCTDEEFLRRATIDIAGLLPTESEYLAFIGDTTPDKRQRKIEELLARKEFSEIWAMKWAQLLMIKSNNQVSYKAAFLYNSWLTNQIAANVPIDKIVQKLLASSGGVFKEPTTNFYQIENDTLKVSENVAQVFMGIRTQCAQCHNHPFDRWTMDDYYGFAAFFAQIGRKTGEDYRETIVFDRRGGEVKHPVTGADTPPRFLGGGPADIKSKDRREVLAQWITSTENPFFSASVANRIWHHFMGSGIVDPVDDFRVSNPASNPELLAELGKKLTEYQFDTKQLVRDICNSQAYQRSCSPTADNQDDLRNYSHAAVRRIPAENLLDCISAATQTKDKFRGLPIGARAVQIADGSTSTYFLTAFGRSARTTVCACEASTDPSLSQALHLLNGSAVQGKIMEGQLLKQWTDQGLSPEQIIEKIYLRCLGRKPSDTERATLMKIVTDSGNPSVGLEDVFWATLNSREFLFNH